MSRKFECKVLPRFLAFFHYWNSDILWHSFSTNWFDTCQNYSTKNSFSSQTYYLHHMKLTTIAIFHWGSHPVLVNMVAVLVKRRNFRELFGTNVIALSFGSTFSPNWALVCFDHSLTFTVRWTVVTCWLLVFRQLNCTQLHAAPFMSTFVCLSLLP